MKEELVLKRTGRNKKAFAQLPDLSECESLVDYGNVEYTKGSLSEVQEEMGHLAARVIQQHHQSFLLVEDMISHTHNT